MKAEEIEFRTNGMSLDDRLSVIFDFCDGGSVGKARAVKRLIVSCGHRNGESITESDVNALDWAELSELVNRCGDWFAAANVVTDEQVGN